MIVEPLLAGADQTTVTCAFPAVAELITGAFGSPLRVTVTDCGEPASMVWLFPAVSSIENVDARVSVDTTATPFVVAVDTAVIVHTSEDV